MSVDKLKYLRQALVPYGLKLLEPQWLGWNAQYRFRCRRGHESSRSGSHLLYYLVACPACRDAESLGRLQTRALQAGGRCLNETYLGRTIRHQFECREGHVFEKTPINLQKGTWCVTCARAQHSKRMTDPAGLKGLRTIAKERGGRCLSTQFTRLVDRYRFQCAQGHEWTTSGHEVKRGAWCRICADQKKVLAYRSKDGLERLRECARSHGGTCLASQYEGSKAYYAFRCREGHEWETLGARIFRGTWCPQCQHAALRFGIDAMRKLAAEKGGVCLSQEYRNAATRLEWECGLGHHWQATAASIVAGHWCAACHRESLTLGIDLMREIAVEHGGKCVSETYINSSTRLEWECARGHRWLATPNTIRNGHWCARCYFIRITTRPETQRKRRHEPVVA